jgi:sugar phosphate isomerase/epimerase
MTSISRRDMGKLLAAGTAGLLIGNRSAKSVNTIDSTFAGVQIGAQSYSFRDRDLDACIKAYQTIGIGECELWQAHVEPQHVSREELRRWRLKVPMSHFRAIRRKFDEARVLLYAYNYSFATDFTDAEYTRGFEMARALGVRYITASSNVSLVHKVDALAQKYKIVVGFHNHSNTANPDSFSNAASFERGLKGTSRWVGVNLDIGHFVAANSDPVSFLRKWHSRVATLHLKDRKRNNGADLPWGEGDTPLIAVLRLVRDHHWKFPGNIEYEYNKPGLDTIAEVRKCLETCKRILTTDCQGSSCY